MPRALKFLAPVVIVAMLCGMTSQIWGQGIAGHSGSATPEAVASPIAASPVAATPIAAASPIAATPIASVRTTVVEEEGFTVDLDTVTVTGPPGVAPSGVAVQTSLIEQPLPGDVTDFAEAASPAVEITLGDNLQPAVPLVITFAPEVVAGLGMPGSADDEYLPMVISSKHDAPGWEFADAQLLPDGSVAVNAPHLSFVQLVLVPVSKFADWFMNQVLIFFDMRSEQPGCFDSDTTDSGWEFSTIRGHVIWPCVDASGENLTVSFTNNSAIVWLLSSDDAVLEGSDIRSVPGFMIAGLRRAVMGPDAPAPLIAPDTEIEYTASGDEPEIVFDVQLSDGLTKLNALMQVLFGFIPGELFEQIGHAECLADIVTLVIEDVDDSPGELFSTIVGCFADGLGLLAKDAKGFAAARITLLGALISAVAALPGALWAGIQTAISQIAGIDEFTITLSKIDGESTARLPQANATPIAHSAWPTDRNDSVQGLYTWIGASSVWPGTGISGMPDWVACDDARDYCLLGYNDGDHVLVQIDGFEVIGTIADWYPDPKEALLILGMTEEAANQILGL